MSFSPEYRDYMRSEAWRERRARALKRAGFRCQICGEDTGKLEVHHNRYDNLGNERDEDLVALCGQCHRVVTTWLRARRFWRGRQGHGKKRRR